MSTCQTCRWWIDNENALTPLPTYRVCTNPKLCEPSRFDKGADSLVFEYDEGGVFCPGPDFGCVHHSEKGING